MTEAAGTASRSGRPPSSGLRSPTLSPVGPPQGAGRRRRSVWIDLAGFFVVGVAVKAFVVFAAMPSAWLWLDELYYAVTAFDLGHPDAPGAPHPGFLFYPPLASVFVLPVFRMGLSPDVAYPLALAWQNALLTTTIFAAVLLHREVFGTESRFVPAFLLFSAPAYTALLLMSEPLFITLYAWSLVFFARAARDRRLRDYLWVGALTGLMALTRRVGPAIGAALLVCYVVEAVLFRGSGRRAWRPAGPAAAVGLALALPALWSSFTASVTGTELGGHSLSKYFEAGIVAALTDPGELASLLRRMIANVGYASMATLGFLLPAVAWGFVAPGRAAGETNADTLRLVALNVFAVLAASAAAAGVHMYVQRESWLPRYDMYGRYVEHATLPLIVLGFGCLERFRGGPVGWRLAIVGLVGVAGVVSALVLPDDFFVRSMRGQIAPNSLGIALLVPLAVESAWWWVPFTLGAVLAAWVLLLPPGRGTAAARVVVLGACVVWALGNYASAVREVSRSSQGSERYHSACSRWVSENRELFPDGLYVDFRFREEFAGPHPRMFHVVLDHLDLVIAGEDPLAHLGRIPVFTREEHDGFEVLYEDEASGYRIYGTRPAAGP